MSGESEREPFWKLAAYWLLTAVLLVALIRTPHLLSTLKATNDRAWLELAGFWLFLAVAINLTRRRLQSQAATSTT